MRVAALAVLAVVVLASVAYVIAGRSGATPSREAGFVFLDGAYLDPPYRYEASANGEIRINGRVARAQVPSAHRASAGAAPASMTSAGTVLRAAAAKMEQLGTLTAPGRAELVAFIRSAPAVASVEETDSSIAFTDREGRWAELVLTARPAPSRDDILAGRNDQLARWQGLVASGGVLLLTKGTTLEVPAQRAGRFLEDLLGAYRLQPEARRTRMDEVVGAPPVSAALLAAGEPPASLRGRIPPSTTSLLRRGPTGGSGGHLARPAADEKSHKDSETPGSPSAYILNVVGFTRELAPVRDALRRHGYTTVEYATEECDPGGATIETFLHLKGRAGVLYVAAHGSPKALMLERYCTFEESDEALGRDLKLVADLNDIGLGSADGAYYVELRAVGIRHNFKDVSSIVQLAACETWPLRDAFAAREFLAPPPSICGRQAAEFNEAFWPRLDGTKDDGTKRNVIDAYEAARAAGGSDFLWASKAGGKTVLSPAVSEHQPGAAVRVGTSVKGTVTFDALMDTSRSPAQLPHMLDLKGCDVDPLSAVASIRWRGDRTFEFTFVPQKEGTLTLTIVAGATASRTIGQFGVPGLHLDGNQDPPSTDHVGANFDDYTWTVPCVATAVVSPERPVTPTPSAASPLSFRSFNATFLPDISTTAYTIAIDDPTGAQLLYYWSIRASCGGLAAPQKHSDQNGYVHEGCDVNTVERAAVVSVRIVRAADVVDQATGAVRPGGAVATYVRSARARDSNETASWALNEAFTSGTGP